MKHGFSLAELLITLGIVATIAVFTIPKLIQSQSTNQYNEATKHAVMEIQKAFLKYQYDNQLTGSTVQNNITPYLNFVRRDTVSQVDDAIGWPQEYCSDSRVVCLKLHTGAIMWYYNDWGLCDTSSTSGFRWYFDPDGKFSGSSTQNAPGKTLMLMQYVDGKIKTAGELQNNTCLFYSGIPNYENADPSLDPTWWQAWN